MNDKEIKAALYHLDEFLGILNPMNLGIFKVRLGRSIDPIYEQKIIDVFKDGLKLTK